MAAPPRQLPVPSKMPTASTWSQFRTKLTDYGAQVHQAFQSQQLQQVDVTMTGPSAGTVPFAIAARADNVPQAALIADGVPLHYPTDWTMAVSAPVPPSAGTTTITFLTATPTKAWFSWLVAR